MRRVARVALVSLAAVLATGCFESWGRSIAIGAVDGVKQRQDSLTALERAAIDSAKARLVVALDSAILPRVLGTTSKVADTAHVQLRAIGEDVAKRVLGQVDTSMQALLRNNLGIAHASSNAIVDDAAVRVSALLDAQLHGNLRFAADSISYYAVLAMTRAIRDSLQPVVHDIVTDAREQVNQAVRSTDNSLARSKTLQIVLWSIGIAIALGLAGGCVFLWLALRRRQTSLSAVVDAIDAAGSDALRQEIAARAAASHVDPWLSKYVRSRRVARGVVAPIATRGYSSAIE